MELYDYKAIESKWQKIWKDNNVYATDISSSKNKCYVLDMFPYPSGEGLHIGHPKGYTATDIYSRMKRMQGYEVLHPMGWDAFGLPAEQFAIKNKVHPRLAVSKNIARFKEQLEGIGFSYDWERQVDTTDPLFYRWTQWIFKQMFKKGLAYESYEPINWCPSCQTGLANEDLENGKCERCGSEVEKRPLRQWVLKITEYADRMLEDLDDLNWPEHIKESQRNWIGKSEGVEFTFDLVDAPEATVTIFTTRADTIYGATFVAISAELAEIWIKKGWKAGSKIEDFVQSLLKEQEHIDYSLDKEKKGIFTGSYAINPATKEKIPVWIANYVIGGVGTGAIMAVPAHDERDWDFAQQHGIEVKEVIRPYVIDHVNVPREDKPTKIRKNVHAIVYDPRSKKYLIIRNEKHGWDTVVIGGIEEGEDVIEAAKRELMEETGYTDVMYKRTLGNPVQAGYFAKHKDENRVAIATAVYFELQSDTRVPIAEDGENEGNEIMWIDAKDFVPGKMINSELPHWLLRLSKEEEIPYVGEGILINSGEDNELSSLEARNRFASRFGGAVTKRYKLQDWVFARQRYWGEPFPIVFDEEHTAYTVADSELPVALPEVENYEPTGTGESPLANIKEWVEVYGYINQDNEFVSLDKSDSKAKKFTRETNTMPQWAGSSWYYLRYIDPHNSDVLVDKEKEKKWSPVDFYVGGAEHATRHLIYARFYHKFLFDLGVVHYKEPFTRLQNVGLILGEDGKKISKRLGNGPKLDIMLDEFGADTLRVYEMFMGPFDQSVAWSTKNMKGSFGFLERVWKLKNKVTKDGQDASEVLFNLHKAIKKVGEDIELFKFNTAISQMMICLNTLEKQAAISEETYTLFLQILAPFAPHITEELWSMLGKQTSIHQSLWPSFDERHLVENEITMMIQINGKIRGSFIATPGEEDEAVLEKARHTETYQKFVGNNLRKKSIVVKDKLINIVL